MGKKVPSENFHPALLLTCTYNLPVRLDIVCSYTDLLPESSCQRWLFCRVNFTWQVSESFSTPIYHLLYRLNAYSFWLLQTDICYSDSFFYTMYANFHYLYFRFLTFSVCESTKSLQDPTPPVLVGRILFFKMPPLKCI